MINKTMEDNSLFLVNSMIKKLFLPSFLAGGLGALSPLLSCFLLSLFVGNEAMITSCLFAPVYVLWDICADAVGIGGSIVFSQRLSAGDLKGADDIFHKALVSIITAGFLVALIPFINLDTYVKLLGATAEIKPMAVNQAKWICLVTPFYMIYWVLSFFIRNDSAPKLAFIGFVVQVCVEAATDIICLYFLRLGLCSVAIGMLAGYITGIAVYLSHFLCSSGCLSLKLAIPLFKDIALFYKNSMSDVSEQLFRPVANIIFNNLIIRYMGMNVMTVWALLSPCQSLNQGFEAGLNNAFTAVISSFHGEKNGNAVYLSIKKGIVYSLSAGLFFFAVLFIFSKQFVNLFGGGLNGMEEICVEALRLYILSIPLFYMNEFLLCAFQSTEHSLFCAILSVIKNFLFPVLFGIPAIIAVSSVRLWFTGIFVETVFLAVFLVSFFVLTRHKKCSFSFKDYFSYPQDYKAELKLIFINACNEFEEYREMIELFCKRYNIEKKANSIILIIEEFVIFISEEYQKHKTNDFIDCGIFVYDNIVSIKIRSCIPFIKVEKLLNIVNNAHAGEHLEMRIIFGTTKQVCTTQINGFNCITMTL